jgi:hypothetical protein
MRTRFVVVSGVMSAFVLIIFGFRLLWRTVARNETRDARAVRGLSHATVLASEPALARLWDTAEEDTAWRHL